MPLIATVLLQVATAATAVPAPQEVLQQEAPAQEVSNAVSPEPQRKYPPSETVPYAPPQVTAYPPPPPPSRFSGVPKPRNNPGSWVGTYDYPLVAMLLKETGRSQFRVTVGADGKVSDCTIISTSGFDRLDRLTCKLVTRRARFYPAMDRWGTPIAGQYTQAVRWLIPDPEPLRASDFGWKRPAEAKKLKQRGTVGFLVEISADGAIASCRINRSSGFALLDAETCKRLEALKTPSIALDEAGQPVARTVRSGISW